MPFKFKHVVQLLQNLDTARLQAQTASHQQYSHPSTTQIVRDWFTQHDSDIARHGPSAVAFLSCLLLDRLSHRVYWLRERTLARLLPEALFLNGTARGRDLFNWEKSNLDFATYLATFVVAPAENNLPSADNEVTLEEIDEALQQLATRSSDVTSADSQKTVKILRHILARLQSTEAKWFVRIILKSYNPVEIPDHLVLGSFHFLLPDIIPFQNSLEDAVSLLLQPDLISIPHDPSASLRAQYRHDCARRLRPKIGAFVKRQEFEKARSLAYCCERAGGKTMSVETKYDGYYCQIHVQKSRGKVSYTTFSKKSKNLTRNWTGLRKPIEVGLRLDTPECPIKSDCILEADMLIYNYNKAAIQQFGELRKHIESRGRKIGAESD